MLPSQLGGLQKNQSIRHGPDPGHDEHQPSPVTSYYPTATE
ncbi:MAG: hypothetical protein QOF90_1393 [Acetobacteraceae bacterium]|jgi:hypothetical protein|nr:hypothetical protein [Acetobacteraceae bacterium]